MRRLCSLLHSAGSVIVVTVITGTACARGAREIPPSRHDATVAGEIARLRSATRAFQALDSAVAAGYPRDVRDCLVHEHHGAMGYHHANRALADGRAEVERPEILLYERLADGAYRLNGVEFIVPYRFWPRDSIPPRVMGQRMKREDNLKFWYLHAWVWNENPEGVFADFHPGVSCSAESRKIFRPSIDGPDVGAPSGVTP